MVALVVSCQEPTGVEGDYRSGFVRRTGEESQSTDSLNLQASPDPRALRIVDSILETRNRPFAKRIGFEWAGVHTKKVEPENEVFWRTM